MNSVSLAINFQNHCMHKQLVDQLLGAVIVKFGRLMRYKTLITLLLSYILVADLSEFRNSQSYVEWLKQKLMDVKSYEGYNYEKQDISSIAS